MKRIHDSILALVKPGRIATAAAELGEPVHKIEAGVTTILPHMLDKLMHKGNSKEVEEVLTEGKRLKVYENYDKIWKGSGIDTHENIGERLENRLIGVDSRAFRDSVAAKTGLKKEHADRLTNWITGTIAAWFAGEIAHGKSYSNLISELKGEHVVHHHKAAAKTTHRGGEQVVEVVRKKQGSLAWLWWLLGIILLGLLCFCLLRNCHRKPAPVETVVVEEVKTVHEAPAFTEERMMLPDGTPITMYRGDIEKAIATFLASDKFKNATEAELHSVWFEFGDIDFEHNSATALMPGAQKQLDVVTAALKSRPDVRIKVGAFADKTGSRATNFAISEARAKNIVAALKKDGAVKADRVTYEGFGEEYAKVDEKASNDLRAPDRDIAMRFTK